MRNATPTPQARISMQLAGIQQMVQEMQQKYLQLHGQVQKLGGNQRNSWIRYNDELICISAASCIRFCDNHIEIEFPDRDSRVIDPMEFEKVRTWNTYIGDTVQHEIAAIIMGWLASCLMDCGAGVLDLKEQVGKLSLKGQEPVDPEKVQTNETDPSLGTDSSVAQTQQNDNGNSSNESHNQIKKPR